MDVLGLKAFQTLKAKKADKARRDTEQRLAMGLARSRSCAAKGAG